MEPRTGQPAGQRREDDTPTTFAEELTSFEFRHLEWLKSLLKPFDLDAGKRKTLRVLRDTGPHGVTALALLLDLEPKRMTERIDAMERDGLVRRVDHPGDRRAKLIELTASGSKALARVAPLFADASTALLAALDPREVAQLQAYLQRLTARLTELKQVPAALRQLGDEPASDEW